MIKGQFTRKIALINICVPNIRPPKSMKQILTELKKETDSDKIAAGGINVPFSVTDRTMKHISKGERT